MAAGARQRASEGERTVRCGTVRWIITGASLRANQDRSEAGVAAIDVDGDIQLIDESGSFDAAEGGEEGVEVDDEFDLDGQLDAQTSKQKQQAKRKADKEKEKEKTKEKKQHVPIVATRGDAQAAASRTAAFTEQREQRLAARSGAQSDSASEELAADDSNAAGPDAATRSSSAHWDDLTVAPAAPSSSTHSSTRRPDAQWESLDAKSSWQQARKPSRRERERGEEEKEGEGTSGSVEPVAASAAWGNLKHAAMPSIGWAEARARTLLQEHLKRNGGTAAPAAAAAAATNSAPVDPANPFAAPGDIAASGSSSSGTVWTDEELLSLFPHLRTTAAGAVGKPVSVVLAELVADVRRRYPELEKLHYGSTLVKVQKWRELLGATRMELPTEVGAVIEGAAGGASASAAAGSSVAPSNALHHRYFQSDIFLTVDDVSNILMRQRDLLYVNIEKVVVPRLSILRSHLPGVNLSAVILRHPGLLLSDLHASLPLKLRELRALFPEVNLTTLVEKDASILSHAASSYLLPRLNLFAQVSAYEPRHVVQFLAVEHPSVLAMRWNRLKRIEIVRDERFWSWWADHPLKAVASAPETTAEAENAADAAVPSNESIDATAEPSPSDATAPIGKDGTAAAVTPASASDAAPAAAAPKPNDPASLPFALYHDLLTMTTETFNTTFPWWSIASAYTPLERELFAAQAHAVRDNSARKAADDRGQTLPAPTAGSAAASAASRHALGTVSAAMLASVPGNPQPLSLALGLTPDAQLSRDELRAKQRMDYLALKARKREEREARKDYMRAQEREHQQKKMSEYTSKFQSYRNKTLTATHVTPLPDATASQTDASGLSGSVVASSLPPVADNAFDRRRAAAIYNSEPARPASATRRHGFEESSYPPPRTTRAAYAPRDDQSYSAISSAGRERRGGGATGFGREREGSNSSGGGERGSFRDRTRGDRGGFQQPHQKNRPGSVQSMRHQAHPQGRVESFGARPTPITPFGQQQFGQTPVAPGDKPKDGSKSTPRWRV